MLRQPDPRLAAGRRRLAAPAAPARHAAGADRLALSHRILGRRHLDRVDGARGVVDRHARSADDRRLDRRRRRSSAADAQSGRAVPAEHADERAAAVWHDVPRDRARRAMGDRTSTPRPTSETAIPPRRPTTMAPGLGARGRVPHAIRSMADCRGGDRAGRRRAPQTRVAIHGRASSHPRSRTLAVVDAGRVSREQQGDGRILVRLHGFLHRGKQGAGTSAAGVASSLGWPGPPDGIRVALARMRLGDRNRLDVRAIAIARGTHRHAGTRGRRGAAVVRLREGAPVANSLRRASRGRRRGHHRRWRRPVAAPRARGRRHRRRRARGLAGAAVRHRSRRREGVTARCTQRGRDGAR